ncbi:hypothetical protein [Vreelandella titanicae]|uniref:hypothetical protein n=1 Tax=Vreelandella titanicae TaxID=664683 RepID=UPI001681B6DA|nr:hypothetical protein [Halomonas titanicae]QNU62045.1 hypothetical protein HZS52_20210 [Halomonas titanicae]
MQYCEYEEQIPCLTNDYNKFDSICNAELAFPISADEIINHSDFCIILHLDLIEESQDDLLSVNEMLTGLKDKTGVYHLWIEKGHCEDHDIHSMICVYVGKGLALKRIKQHIKEKWPAEETLHISFYECENRISKYLEQLFLDTYHYHLNTSENCGEGTLYGRWSAERYDIGTELHTHADIYSRKNPGLGL